MTDRRKGQDKRNYNRSKARADMGKRQAFASSRQGKKIHSKSTTDIKKNINTKSRSKNGENSSRRPKNDFFFGSDKNIHDDVRTTYKSNYRRYPKRRKNVKTNKLGIVAITFLILLIFIYYGIALFDVQVLKSKEMSAKANNQYYRKMTLPAKRGDIYDRNGKLLATTRHVFRIGVTPKHVYSLTQTQTETEIVKSMASVLQLDENDLSKELAKKDADYIQIADKVSQEQAELLDQYLAVNQIGGVRLDAEPERVYFNGDVGSQIIGFASNDENGLVGRLGVEYQMNDILSGQSGYLFAAKDNYLNAGDLPFSQSTTLPNQNGLDVYLTCDYDIEEKLQEHVQNAVEAMQAENGGMGIVYNVKTGEVLALASYPYFSSSNPTAKPENWDETTDFKPETQKTVDLLMEHYWKNKAISDLYEVGSTFKTVTLAIGLEEDVTAEDKIYSDSPIQVLDYTIKSWTGDELFGELPLQDAFLYSLNPPFVQIALDVGIDTYYNYIDALGLKHKSGIELPGEIANVFHENPSKIDLATLAFGEQSSMNLVSYAKALASVVNGGNLLKPTIIKQITNDQNAVVKSFEPQVERRVISEKTSERVNNLLARNDELQGMNRVSAGYQMGGKTSTSVNEATDALTLSYAGFAPIDDPEIMVLIVAMNSHTETVASDSLINNVAGMMDFTLDHLNIERKYTDEQINMMRQKVALSDLNGYTLEDAMNNLNYQSINITAGVENMKPNDVIVAMVPTAGTSLHYGSKVYVYPSMEIKSDLVVVPDFTGKNYNECMIAANNAGVTLNFEGDLSGLATSQTVLYDYSVLTNEADQFSAETDIPADNDANDMKGKNETSVSVQRGSIINIVLESVPAD